MLCVFSADNVTKDLNPTLLYESYLI